MKTDDFLPVTRLEMERRGWEEADVIIVTGDAYVDHPAFGAAVIGRLSEKLGMRTAILPQPNWRDDLRDFRKLGRPRLFFGVTSGCMDSMVNHYTAFKRIRSDDAYTSGGRAGARPDYAVTVYTRILKQLFPDTPVVIGGIEASLRRLTHYDYWQDCLKPSVLVDSGADMLVYGMGEQPVSKLIQLLDKGVPFASLHNILQTAYLRPADTKINPLKGYDEITLASHEACRADKKIFAETFLTVERLCSAMRGKRLIQRTGDVNVVVNPAFAPADAAVADLSFDLPYTRLPHPKYRHKPRIPAYEMIKDSVTIHRGCFGGCGFCAVSAHQGKFVVSRSEKSILNEVKTVAAMPGFKGHITDLGGPSANMYRMAGADADRCAGCSRPSCLFPGICANLRFDHHPLIKLYAEALKVEGVKKITIGSGIRHDMLTGRSDEENKKYGLDAYFSKLLKHHVSGRLKAAPEHSDEKVLRLMRKPSFKQFRQFHKRFYDFCKTEHLSLQLVTYFISGHPGCTERQMEELSAITAKLGIRHEQVQAFTPTPMTLSSVIYYAGVDPSTGKPVYSARSPGEKKRQKDYFFRRQESAIRSQLSGISKKHGSGVRAIAKTDYDCDHDHEGFADG